MSSMSQSRSSPKGVDRYGLINRMAGFALWELPGRWIVYAVLLESVALVLALASFTHGALTDVALLRFGILLALGMVQAELSRRIERDRRRMSGSTHINMTSIWLIPAVLMLPPQLVAVLCVALYTHMWLRIWQNLRNVSLHRTVFGASAAILACLAANTVSNMPLADRLPEWSWGVTMACLLGGLTFELVDALLLAVSINLRSLGNATLTELFGSWDDNALELTTLCLGGLTALTLVYQPLFTVLLFCPIVVLHRSVLVKELEAAATIDVKTGLLNAVTWHHMATQELARTKQDRRATVGVLMVDLDHFKRVNDTYGHLAGDAVLKSVAAAVKGQVRADDAVGRFGGEEFVVLLPGVDDAGALVVAERIRKTVGALYVMSPQDGVPIAGLTCSIGVAVHRSSGTTMERLLLAADTAVYRAKRTGRNRVVSTMDKRDAA
ncbi:diguanylate cyclase [Kutzneria sp. CA-103260]|nr:diguanylate cyclase [Kutzneria sp. CA-103260]